MIRRGRDIEFRSRTGITLEGPVVLRMSCWGIGRRRRTARRSYGGFWSRIQSHALLRDVRILQILRGLFGDIAFYELSTGFWYRT